MVKSYTKIVKLLMVSITLYILASSLSSSVLAVTEDTNFNVNVRETLSVSITTPTEWASGDIDTFLRNKVNVSVTSNNTAGFTASMTTKTNDTFLTNTSKSTYTLPTLTANVARSSFPANHWGYSLDDTDAGNASSTYRALVGVSSTPITILTSASATSGSKDFYFGAKADVTQAAGTYTGTVVINVVSGVIDNNTNPATPTNPAQPNSSSNSSTYHASPTGGSSNGVTVTTHTPTSASGSWASGSQSGGTTSTNDVVDGNVLGGNMSAQGVVNGYKTNSNISDGSMLATGLATTSSIAAASGLFLFIAAKRREDDEDEEEQSVE